jgi:hypothetical protein
MCKDCVSEWPDEFSFARKLSHPSNQFRLKKPVLRARDVSRMRRQSAPKKAGCEAYEFTVAAIR